MPKRARVAFSKTTERKDYKGVCVVYYGNTEIQLELEIIAKLIVNNGPVV